MQIYQYINMMYFNQAFQNHQKDTKKKLRGRNLVERRAELGKGGGEEQDTKAKVC